MDKIGYIKSRQRMLKKRYKLLIEQAYNLRQTDSAQSDISSFEALKLLDKINRLEFLTRDRSEAVS